ELKRAAARLALPACVLTFEPHPREFFAPDRAPTRLTSLREKLEWLASYGVDRVHLCRFDYRFAQTSPEDFIERIIARGLGARWVLVGDDFRYGARRAGNLVMLKQAAPRLGFEVAALPSFTLDGERVSSTALREALAEGKLERASRLLGRDYSISGRVVAGDGLGRKLGFPTANILMKHNRPPLMGIFAVRLSVGSDVFPAVASLGVRPTVKQRGAPVLEVHALDYSGDLYRRHVRVEFLEKLRDEEKYADLATLTRQIAADVENARAYFERAAAPAPRRAG
ncbi:MAG TPA: bifunctional riboflavin kinase/FAD synthetase, partial [Burkholderiales bacterium]|nr:bifunctional riboflavin kinase/FAD synthetase [Burkholderiales bacterium]